MSNQDIKTVGIIGSGTMGAGIAELSASNGYKVRLVDLSMDIVNSGFSNIEKNIKKLESRKRITTEESSDILSRISVSDSYGCLSDCEIVIEAVSENLEIKKSVFSNIEKNTGSDTIIATNTSTLSPTELAMHTGRPDLVLGVHFFNPAPVMKLVEIIRTQVTSEETLNRSREFAVSLGKDPVVTGDKAGFIVNRILLPMINEAVFVLDEKMASAEDIDKAMKLGTNQPIGPLALADLIGLDVTLDVLSVLYSEFGDPKFRPASLLREMVRAGYLGRKSGKGFFEYGKKGD